MYSKFQRAKKYAKFYLTASNGQGHGIHSPFVFDFVTNVLKDGKDSDKYYKIENLRKELLGDKTMIVVDDFGAGSAVVKSNQRSISDIARISGSGTKKGRLLFRMAKYYYPETIIELGTSLGLSTAYLASGHENAKLITIEGSPAVAEIAEKNFQKIGLKNIELVRGNFDMMLTSVIAKTGGKIDLVYIDGNHRKEPTGKYFNMLIGAMAESSVIILDDIYWSSDMEAAWNEIKNDPRVLLTIDLFFIGMVFFRKDFKIKQNFKIRFGV